MEVEKMNSLDDDHKDDEVVLPGFRFHPTDEELVGFYLRRKVEKKPFSIELIKQVDIYKYDPWDLPMSRYGVVEKEMYFFCIRGRKYRNSIRPNRVTGSGFWKATGIDKPIYSSTNSHSGINGESIIGLKKSLVYYRGSAGKGTKTDWMMHEFRLPPAGKQTTTTPPAISNILISQEAEVWTLCRIFKRTASYKKYLPDCKQTSSIKQNPADSSSKTCSLESDNNDRYLSFADSFVQQNYHRKHNFNLLDHVDDRSQQLQFFRGQENTTIAQAVPLVPTSNYISFRSNTPNDHDEFSREENWDELRPVVDFAIDPYSHLYHCQ